jgi:hypothetical protein
MKSQPHQSLSKLDAATRQLHLAVDLFFKDADPIGVHTLAGAAHGILCGLVAHTGGHNDTRTRGSGVERASRRLVETKITEAKNFLKHADRDPTKVLRFHPNCTDFLIFDVIRMHIRLTQTITTPNCFFLLWLSAKYPHVLLLDSFLEGTDDKLSELRRIFPSLGDPSVQKRTFRAAMKIGASSD